jgi:5,10-methylenetetrahydromethanopterin reductase
MKDLRISCCLPPSKDVPRYARLAEELGYACVFLYDSPALYGDIWMSLARMADATSRIGIGLGVGVPSLRHPLVIAAAIASLEELAAGRVTYGFGAGFTARYTMGQKPLRWVDMRLFFTQLRALLRGETVEIDGGACQMIHSPGFAPRRPITVPLLAAASGPKGYEVAREVADGVFCDREIPRGFARCLQYTFGTVLEPGEDHTSPRVQAAAGPFATTAYHAVWQYGAEHVDAMPGGAAWRASIEAERPPGQRHLATHEGHLVAISERDRTLIEAAGAFITQIGWTGDAEAIRRHLSESASAGATEIVMSMAGPDIPRELRAFALACGLTAQR